VEVFLGDRANLWVKDFGCAVQIKLASTVIMHHYNSNGTGVRAALLVVAGN
jgi:hypothetical protein